MPTNEKPLPNVMMSCLMFWTMPCSVLAAPTTSGAYRKGRGRSGWRRYGRRIPRCSWRRGPRRLSTSGALAVNCVAVLRHERCLPLNHSGFRLVGRDGDERAQDSAHGLRGDVAVGHRVLLGVLAHVVEHRAEVLHVDEQHLPIVGDAEDDVEHAFLHLGEAEQAGKKHRAHVGGGHANGQRRPEERATPRERGPASSHGQPQPEGRARRAHALPWLPSALPPRWERSKRRR